MDGAPETVEAVARRSYARLVAFVAARTRDIAAAEDALAEAFARAIETWPRQGVPTNPEAWLLTVARRAHGAGERKAQRAAAAAPELALVFGEAGEQVEEAGMQFPDERLKLLFVCAHPAIDRAVHTPLMLQTVLGLDAVRIAQAFLVSPAAMSQRLVRAKAKVRQAGVRFAAPDRADLPPRLDAVLEAIFGAYGAGREAEVAGRALADAAIDLGGMLDTLLPGEPEVQGLRALMLYGNSRAAARRDADGRYVPLSEQDPGSWDTGMIDEADALLARAGAADRFGRFQCMAAIEAVHAGRRLTGRIDARALDLLYEALVGLSPTVGVRVAQAAARGEARGVAAGLALLDALPDASVTTYQPNWAVRARLLARAGAAGPARAAFHRAIALAADPAVRDYLALQSDQLG